MATALRKPRPNAPARPGTSEGGGVEERGLPRPPARRRGLAPLIDVARQARRQPLLILEQQAAFLRDVARIVAGESDLAPDAGDRRFQDVAWKENAFYRAWLQVYLAGRNALASFVDRAGFEPITAARARFVVSFVTEALAPTNVLLGNPAAIKRAFETGGASLVRGLQNMLSDAATNGLMPSQVDRTAFQVGKSLAVSRGSVVYRNDVLELIQYAPATDEVHSRPLVLVPPQINKFYVFDLAPGRSLVEHAVKSGLQVFAVSWRNPTAAERHWGLETYVRGLRDAIAAARTIARSKDVNVLAACAGAITLMPLLAHLAARRDARVHGVTLLVAMLDTRAESAVGLFATPQTIALARRVSQLRGVLPGGSLAWLFAWLRPNDLVWNYWVNNYLMGNDPPAFDLLYWNGDSTRLPARLHSDFLDLFVGNPLGTPGALSVLGTRIDLSKVRNDTYVLAGLTDHITPWKGCYAATRMLGGRAEFVLNSSGHIQSVVNPPGNPRARFLTNAECPQDADAWRAGAQEHPGTWWDHWRDWITARSGPMRPAPARLGTKKLPPLEAAPGSYVFES
jgi:poly[(R)-3-hydroxyalkanoate] polymerase subunit PhaC